jgi:hypothetical protein
MMEELGAELYDLREKFSENPKEQYNIGVSIEKVQALS